MIKKLLYQFIDNITPLSAAQFNLRFYDLDARVDVLERLQVSWESAVRDIQNYGLARVNTVVDPYVTEAAQLIADVRTEMEALQAEWADLDMDGQLAAMDARVTALETSISTAQGDIAALQGEMATAQGDITTLQGGLASAQGNITDLQAVVEDLEDRAALAAEFYA